MGTTGRRIWRASAESPQPLSEAPLRGRPLARLGCALHGQSQLTQCDTLGIWRGGALRSPFDPPKARAPVKFAGGGLAPRTPVPVRRWLIAGTGTGDPRGFEEKAGSGMIFAALVGLVFGVSDLDYIEALPRMILFQGLKTAYEMLVPKAFFTGGPSVLSVIRDGTRQRGARTGSSLDRIYHAVAFLWIDHRIDHILAKQDNLLKGNPCGPSSNSSGPARSPLHRLCSPQGIIGPGATPGNGASV